MLVAGRGHTANRHRGCALDASRFNVRAGAAAFVTLILGGLLAVLAMSPGIAAEPPLWTHAMIWLPLTIPMMLVGRSVADARSPVGACRNSTSGSRSDKDRQA